MKLLKRIFSIFLAITILLGLTIMPSADSATPLSSNVYYIYTAEDMYNVRNDLAGTYYLMNDIDLSQYESWEPIGNADTPFTGTFDGQGFEITGLNIDIEDTASGYYYIGLFGLNSGEINKLGVEGNISINVNSSSSDVYICAGGLVGKNYGKIENCYASVDITSNAKSTQGRVSSTIGGLFGIVGIGYPNTIYEITDCYATGDITSTNITETGSVSSTIGGLFGGCSNEFGYRNGCTITNCYATGNLTSTNTKETSVSSNANNCCVGGLIGSGDFGRYGSISITDSYATGNITSENSCGPNYAGGLIGYGRGTVNNIINCHATGNITSNATRASFSGGLIGYFFSEDDYSLAVNTISGCYATGDINSTTVVPTTSWTEGNNAGGLIGYYIIHNSDGGELTISDCYALGNVVANAAGDSSVGGLIGYSEAIGEITECYAEGNVTSNSDYNSSETVYYDVYAGGLSGFGFLDTVNCYATGDVTSENTHGNIYSGGLIGHGIGYTVNCYATGDVTSTATSKDKYSAHSYAGGLIGDGGRAVNCYATGNVSSAAKYESEYYDFTGISHAGGLIGDGGNSRNCYATGNVSSTATSKIDYLGDFAYGIYSHAGGLIGNGGNAENCYATGNVTSDGICEIGFISSYAHGLIGLSNNYKVTNCYFHIDTGLTDSDATGLTSEQMKNASNFEGFDFEDIWSIDEATNGGYPYIRYDAVISPIGLDLDGCNLDPTDGRRFATLEVEKTLPLIATVFPENAINKNVKWSSDNLDVATVSENGTVTAIAPGTAQVTVTTEDGRYSVTCTVTVVIPVESVSLDKETATMEIDDTLTLIATVLPENATNKNVKWSSDNKSVATVSENGIVTAIDSGTAEITVKTIYGGHTAKCVITVGGNGDFENAETGDLNDDGVTNSDDVFCFMEYLENPEIYPDVDPTIFDYNNDGKVNNGDAIYLLKHTLLPNNRYPLN